MTGPAGMPGMDSAAVAAYTGTRVTAATAGPSETTATARGRIRRSGPAMRGSGL
jgi:hypothetical protein